MNLTVDINAQKLKAFEKTYLSYSRKIRFYVYSYVRDNDKADDITQDVFMALWETLDSLDPQRDVYPHLLVLAKYRCLNYLRSEKYNMKYRNFKKLSMADISIIALSDTENQMYQTEIQTLINKAMESMSPKVRETFILSRYNNLKNKENAAIQNVSEKTIEYRIACAYRILRNILKDYFFLFMLLFPFKYIVL